MGHDGRSALYCRPLNGPYLLQTGVPAKWCFCDASYIMYCITVSKLEGKLHVTAAVNRCHEEGY